VQTFRETPEKNSAKYPDVSLPLLETCHKEMISKIDGYFGERQKLIEI
jgi:hypothetical protein